LAPSRERSHADAVRTAAARARSLRHPPARARRRAGREGAGAVRRRAPAPGLHPAGRRYGDTVYLPARPWEGLYIFSRPDQAEHVLATGQDNYVKPFTYRPLRMLLGDGLLTADETT
jgi:hypothetical protein